MDDDDDMADLYLSRKLFGASSPVSGSGAPNWFAASPTIGSKISRASRASAATIHGNENDVEELEMLLEVIYEVIPYIYVSIYAYFYSWKMLQNKVLTSFTFCCAGILYAD